MARRARVQEQANPHHIQKRKENKTNKKKKVARVRDFSLIVFCLYIRGLKSKDLRKKKKEKREREKEREKKKNAAATRQALLLNIYIYTYHSQRREKKNK